ncbi:MAG: APC family permease [Proteobacteria bacterium]|nr:APC family permease [Pseudomonadota bacterium]
MNNQDTGLQRRLGLGLLTLYGLGTTVGAGIYVLVGKIAERAGEFAPVSFLLAAFLVGFTALSYAELSSRYPKSAGAAVYVSEGFALPALAIIVGLLVIAAGVVSSATLVQGFAGYFGELAALPKWVLSLAAVAVLVAVACWGIGESVIIASLLTLLEVGGLGMVIWAGRETLIDPAAVWAVLTAPLQAAPWSGILAGSFLAFFAFIGFEDIVNVAEEVKDERRTLPTAIGLTLGLTAVLYLAVAAVAVYAMPAADLAASPAPLVEIYERKTGQAGTVLVLIGTFAVINGALIQIIMAARVVYGMASQGWLPTAVASVNTRTRTPVTATFIIGGVVLALALAGELEVLAQTTTVFILCVFTLVNAALFRIKWRGSVPSGSLTVPLWVPATGAVTSAVFLVLTVADLLATAGG